MMTKKRDTAVHIFLVFLMLVPSSLLSGADKWTVAAEKFTFAKERTVTKSESAAAELLPQLILEQLTENLERMPSSQEQLDKKQYDLQKSRLDLFLQLSKEVQIRDSLVLGDYTDRELQKQLKSEDEKIAAIKKQIADNLAQESEYEKNAAPDIAREEEREKGIEAGKVFDDRDIPDREKNDAARFKDILKGFVPGHKQERNSVEVNLYKDDVTQLFDAGDTVTTAGYDSREFEDAVIAAGINALVRGRLTIYGGYVAATVSLVIYPGVRTIGTVTDVSSITDFRALAVSIARQLTPKITNSMPVELLFKIKPEEAAENVVLTIDDVVYKVIPDHLIVQSGVHSVMLSSPGFKQVSTSYAFRGSRQFDIFVGMIPEKSGSLLLRLKKPLIGTMYANGSKTGIIDEEYPVTRISINNQPVLGQFITEDGRPVSFYIPLKLVQDGSSLTVNVTPFDRSKYIDVRRRWMYGSYSALIISLMGTFYSYGTFHAEMLAYGNGYVGYDDAVGWQRAAQVCTGISIGCGVFFAYELVRYFLAADKVLPDRAYPSEYEDREMPASEQSAPDEPDMQKNPSSGDGPENNIDIKNNGVQ
ncbi:MAG: hypothetical protein M0P01_04875 [Treponema sp.]|nr:hypothetical protein [Treponema sp.]